MLHKKKIGLSNSIKSIRCCLIDDNKFIINKIIEDIETEIDGPINPDRTLIISSDVDDYFIEIKTNLSNTTMRSLSYLHFRSFNRDYPKDEKFINNIRVNYDYVIVGKMNLIPVENFEYIRALFSSHLFICFGDLLVDSNEYKLTTAYHKRYLSEYWGVIRSELQGSQIQKKKIHLFLNRLRNKSAIDVIAEKNSSEGIINIEESSDLDLDRIFRYLNSDKNNIVVVPKILLPYVNYNLDTEYGQETYQINKRKYPVFYLKTPLPIYDDNGKLVKTFPALSKIHITALTDISSSLDDRNIPIEVREVINQDSDEEQIIWDKKYYTNLDVEDYLISFEHDLNIKFFSLPNKRNIDFIESAKVSPYRVFSPEFCKYFKADNVLGYCCLLEVKGELYRGSAMFDTFCSATKTIDVVYSDFFDIVDKIL